MNLTDMILYEDKDLLVCRKPAGLPVQSSRVAVKDLVSMLNGYLAEQARPEPARRRSGAWRGQVDGIRVVHRLDQPVEGVLVFAKTKKAAADLSLQAADGRMKKLYRAVCCQSMQQAPAGSGSTWKLGERYERTDFLIRDGKTNISSVVRADTKGAKRAKLEFRILEEKKLPDQRALLLAEIRLHTGRHHQIRVQMSHAGLPLCGDRKYNRDALSWPAAESLALCAASLSFVHPATGKQMTFHTNPQAPAFSLFSGFSDSGIGGKKQKT